MFLLIKRVEVYWFALRALKREEMLQEINSKYPGIEITIEDVLVKVHFLSRLKIPMIISILLLIIIEILTRVVGVMYFPSVGWIRSVYASILWFLLTVGYIIYGRKLSSL